MNGWGKGVGDDVIPTRRRLAEPSSTESFGLELGHCGERQNQEFEVMSSVLQAADLTSGSGTDIGHDETTSFHISKSFHSLEAPKQHTLTQDRMNSVVGKSPRVSFLTQRDSSLEASYTPSENRTLWDVFPRK